MSRKNLIAIIASIFLIGILFVFLLNSTQDKQVSDPNNPEPSYISNRWEPTLSLNSRDPYGLYVFEELTTSSGRFNEFNEYRDYQLLDSLILLDSSLYMYIGLEFTCTNEEVDKLLWGVSQGNDFFLSTEKIPTYLYDQLFDELPITFNTDTKASIIAQRDTFDMIYLYEQDSLSEIWDLFDKKKNLADATVLSEAFNYPIFISVPHGKGKVLLHLNPVTFTNFQLLRKEGKDHLKTILQQFKQPKIQWLTFAKYEPVEYDSSTSENPEDKGLLTELFKFPAFRWAFIIGVFGVLLYFIFRSKRERPIIPALSKTKNTGYSFVDTLAGIYFEGNKSPQMLKVMRKNFYSAVDRHFYIDLAHRKSQREIESLARKARVPEKKIIHLLNLLETQGDISNNYLSKVNKLQRAFYFQSGIWDDELKQKLKNQTVAIYRSKPQSVGVIAIGVLLIVFGFALLSSSVGIGILLWPLGIVAAAIGARMLERPVLKIHQDSITFLPFFSKPKTIRFNEIKTINQDGDLIKIVPFTKAQIIINLATLSPSYRATILDLKNKINA
jgi:hypothetical protein